MTKELYIGLMSGTSMDGIDAALVEIDATTCSILQTLSRNWPDELHSQLKAMITAPEQYDLDITGNFSTALGQAFGTAANDLLKAADVQHDAVTAIGSHGQTVLHAPDADPPFSIQLGNPEKIAADTGIQVIADFRSADMQLGGQGAPLAPAFHLWAFACAGEDRAVVNIGGIANVTLLHADGKATGFDTGPGNNLMDGWIRRHQNVPFDADGNWAAGGTVDEALLNLLASDEYFSRQPPKSTGFEYFNQDWLNQYLEQLPVAPDPQHVQTTLCELTATQIAASLGALKNIGRLAVCGGGTSNQYLMSRLQRLLPNCEVLTTQSWGIDPDWVEAAAFAWLARQRIHGLTSNLPSVTGASAAISLGDQFLPPGHPA